MHSLQVLEVTPSTEGPGWQVVFQNLSSSVITAFALEIITEFDDGTTAKGVQTIDFFQPEDFLQPNSKYQQTFQSIEKKGAGVAGLQINPVTVLFDDLSFEGDATYAEQILKSREAAQLARSHWWRFLRGLMMQTSNEEELAVELRNTIYRMENHTDRVSNHRVSLQHKSAQLRGLAIAEGLKEVLEPSSDTGLVLQDRLERFLQTLESEMVQFSDRVTHSIEGEPLRKARRR